VLRGGRKAQINRSVSGFSSLLFLLSFSLPLRQKSLIIRLHGLKIEPTKCQFFCDKVAYLGHVVSADGVSTDPEKTKAVSEWPAPSTVRDLRSFLGFASYYRRYVPKFAQVAGPLHKVVAELGSGGSNRTTRKQIGNLLTPECKAAFDHLKTLLTMAPLLTPKCNREKLVTTIYK